ncbi:MAG: hypothetical protein NXI09_11695 [Bacteroidetes bacterium]|nr:hypothetical protein [Bacteroidota bacterium]
MLNCACQNQSTKTIEVLPYVGSDDIDSVVEVNNPFGRNHMTKVIYYKKSNTLFLTYNEDGELIDSLAEDKKYRIHGLRFVKLNNGSKRYQNFKHGVKDGSGWLIDEKGIVRERVYYVDGKALKELITYFPNGSLKTYQYLTTYGIVFEQEYTEVGDLIKDRGSPVALFREQQDSVQVGNDFRAIVELAIPSRAELRLFFFNPSDSTLLKEIPITYSENSSYVKIASEATSQNDNGVYLHWILSSSSNKGEVKRDGYGAHYFKVYR